MCHVIDAKLTFVNYNLPTVRKAYFVQVTLGERDWLVGIKRLKRASDGLLYPQFAMATEPYLVEESTRLEGGFELRHEHAGEQQNVRMLVPVIRRAAKQRWTARALEVNRAVKAGIHVSPSAWADMIAHEDKVRIRRFASLDWRIGKDWVTGINIAVTPVLVAPWEIEFFDGEDLSCRSITILSLDAYGIIFNALRQVDESGIHLSDPRHRTLKDMQRLLEWVQEAAEKQKEASDDSRRTEGEA